MHYELYVVRYFISGLRGQVLTKTTRTTVYNNDNVVGAIYPKDHLSMTNFSH